MYVFLSMHALASYLVSVGNAVKLSEEIEFHAQIPIIADHIGSQ